MRCNRLIYLQFGASIALGLSGLLLIYLWPIIYKNLLILQPGSIIYKYWKTIPVDIPTDFYFFNWTNSEDLYNLSVKPKVEELGPYRFWQKEKKVNIKWNQNGTITFQQEKFWFYDTSEKNKNLQDLITTADPLTMGASYELRNWNYYIRKAVFFTLSGRFPSVIKKQTVGEFLFEGYEEPLLKVAAALPVFAHLNLPSWNRFGWLYQRNGSVDADGTFNMGTGINSTLGQLYFWNYKNRTPYFKNSCANIYGSAGQFFPQNLKKDFVSTYSSDLRRSGILKFEKEETVGNILGYKYVLDNNFFDNGTLFSGNFCFCNGECVPSGMLNVSATRHGSPAFVSMPHFYNADPYYTNLVDGLKIDPKKHDFYMIIEPITGIPLKVDVKVQLNLLLQPIPGIRILEKIPKFFLPILWTRQTYEINGLHSIMLKLLINISTIFTLLGTLLMTVCIGLGSFATYRYYKIQQVSTKHKKMFEDQSVSLSGNLDENFYLK